MDGFVRDLAVTGALPEGLDWRPFFNFEYLWNAQDALGMARRPASL